MPLIFGDPKIDADHDLMLALSSSLLMSTSEERRIVMSTLLDYVTEHCVYEERFMDYIGYPEIEKHKQLHRDLQDFIIDNFSQMLRANSGDSILEIVHKGISDHILKEDAKIANYFNTTKGKDVT